MNNELEDKLKELDEEDLVWFIFIILFIIKMYSNLVERNYRINNSESDRVKYHNLNIFTYVIAIAIALYYIYVNWESNNKRTSLITNGLSIIGLLIFLFLELNSDD